MELDQVYLYDEIECQLKALSDEVIMNEDIRASLHDTFQILTKESLQQSIRPPFKGLSRINPNGLPFQWCFCLNNERPSVRFVCEAGIPGTTAYDRYKFSLQKLVTICHRLNYPYPSWLTDKVINQVMPDIYDWPDWWESALWFAVAASDKQVYLKIYLNLNFGVPLNRWRRVGRVLQGLDRHNCLSQLCELSENVSHESWPTGLAIDIQPNGEAGRVKIYFHSGEVNRYWLENWYHALAADGELKHINRMLELFPYPHEEAYPTKAFFVSLEFGADCGVSLKTDLTVSRWMPQDSEIILATSHFAESLGLCTSAYFNALKAIGICPVDSNLPSSHHLVGFGYETDGSRHINVYCEPPLKLALKSGYKV